MKTNLKVDEIYKILENEIVQLKIPPGETISENSLCKRFNISRTPIRSVLQRLQQKGFVQIVPHKGTIVTSINLHLACQWIYQRLAVECMVLRDFINICSPGDITHIRFIHQALHKIAENFFSDPLHFNAGEFLQTDLSMHKIWFQATDKLYLWDHLIQPQANYTRFICLDVMSGHNVPDVLEEHSTLIEILETKNLSAIEPLLRKHLYGGVRRMGSKFFSEDFPVQYCLDWSDPTDGKDHREHILFP